MHEGPPVLTSPEEIKNTMEEINLLKLRVENSLNSVEKDNASDIRGNVGYFIKGIIDICNQNNHGDEFGILLSEVAQTYADFKKYLFQLDLNPDQIRNQLNLMNDGAAATEL